MSIGIVSFKSKDEKDIKNIKKKITNKNTALLDVLYLDTLYFIIPIIKAKIQVLSLFIHPHIPLYIMRKTKRVIYSRMSKLFFSRQWKWMVNMTLEQVSSLHYVNTSLQYVYCFWHNSIVWLQKPWNILHNDAFWNFFFRAWQTMVTFHCIEEGSVKIHKKCHFFFYRRKKAHGGE